MIPTFYVRFGYIMAYPVNTQEQNAGISVIRGNKVVAVELHIQL
jgi:hypothetical protein